MKCKFCKHYTFEGHRGGHCNLMNVTLVGNMAACPFGVSKFETENVDINPTLGVHTHVSFVRPRIKV